MSVLDDLGMTVEDLRAAVSDRPAEGRSSSLVAPAPDAQRGPRRRPAPYCGDPRREVVLGESAVQTALDVREQVEAVIERAAAEGAAWATGPLAEHLREHVEGRLYAASALDNAAAVREQQRRGDAAASTAFRDFLRESGDDINDDAIREMAREGVI
jgi:hypothetical protein